MAAQRRDDPDHDEWNEQPSRDGWEGFGEFGVTSAEIPAVYPNGPVWRKAWAAQQKARTLSLQVIEACYQQRMISGPAVDLLQDEFSQGFVPELRYHPQRRVWLVWSAYQQRWFTLDSWEQRAQAALPIDHPERVTAVLRSPDRPTDRPTAPRPFDACRAC